MATAVENQVNFDLTDCSSDCVTDLDNEPYVFNESHHSARLLEGLRHLRDCSQLFDVTLVVEGHEFPAHRVVLASCSDYFHAMFTNGLKESWQQRVVLNGVAASAIEQLIHFAYTSNLKISKENVVEVLSGACHVQILPAVHACETYLSSHLTLHNCVEMEQIADLYCLKKLQSVVHCFICKNWREFTQTPAFLVLSLQQLEEILRSDFPVYCSEVEVLKALLIWVEHELSERESLIPQLLALVSLVEEQSLAGIIESLFQSPEIQRVAAAYPKLESLLSGLGAVSVKTVSGVVNTRGYFETMLVVGGFQQGPFFERDNSVMYFDPDSQQLVPYTTIPHVQQADCGLEVLDNCLYVVGGCSNEDFLEVTHPFAFRFDPTSNEWTRLPPMTQERCRFYLGELGGFLYAIGGEVDNIQLLDSCEVFDPQQLRWSPIAPLPCCCSELAGTSLGGRLYVSGGVQDQFERTLNQFWCYNPDTDTWQELAPMMERRANHTMVTYRDRIYVIGGWRNRNGGREAVKSIDRYDPESNRWQTVQHMKDGTWNCVSKLFQDQVYVMKIDDEGQLDRPQQVEVLDMESMEWLPAPFSLPRINQHSSVAIHLPRVAHLT